MLERLYRSCFGRALLKLLTSPAVSRVTGKFLSCSASRILIAPFIKKNDIDLSEVQDTNWSSFNAFFIRKLKPGARPVCGAENDLISPCDAFLTVCPITKGATFEVKYQKHTLNALLQNAEEASEFNDGYCFVFRLTPKHYHRYCFPDSGTFEGIRKLSGVLHMVRPLALERYPVFCINSREIAILNTDHYGKVIQIEVGATVVGKISNTVKSGRFEKGMEKGYFEFGGSTILLLLKKGSIKLDQRIQNAIELPVKMGEIIGTVYNSEIHA